jgi:hypothetical protein
MPELVRTLDVITAEAKAAYEQIEWTPIDKLVELILEARPLVPHGQWQKYLTDNFPRLGLRQIYRYIEVAKDETKTKTLASLSHDIKPNVSLGHIQNRQEKPQITQSQFDYAVTKLKKEKEAMFENRGTFALNRISELLAADSDTPLKVLQSLMQVDISDLAPADLNLTLEIMEACGKLATRASNWHHQLKEKFHGK